MSAASRAARAAHVGLVAATLLVVASQGACKGKDGSPDAVVRTTWRAAIEGNGAAFRATYPTEAELRALFEPAMAKTLLDQIELGAKSVPKKPPAVEISDIVVEKEADVPAGAGLLRPARLARVKLQIKLPRVEPEAETMTLVKLGELWRALPKAAASLLP